MNRLNKVLKNGEMFSSSKAKGKRVKSVKRGFLKNKQGKCEKVQRFKGKRVEKGKKVKRLKKGKKVKR